MKPKNPHAGRWYCLSCGRWHDDGPLSRASADTSTGIRIVNGRIVRVPLVQPAPEPERVPPRV